MSWASWLLLTGVHALCACTVSWASWLLVTGVHALCVVVCVRRPGPPGSRSPVCTLCVWWCVYGVLGFLAGVHLPYLELILKNKRTYEGGWMSSCSTKSTTSPA